MKKDMYKVYLKSRNKFLSNILVKLTYLLATNLFRKYVYVAFLSLYGKY